MLFWDLLFENFKQAKLLTSVFCCSGEAVA